MLWRALRSVAPWRDQVVLDLGCGTGFWLPKYVADGAAAVLGAEPDTTLLAAARTRCPDLPVLAGSAEHIPMDDASVDVIHARFAYFWGAGSEAGLAEVRRVLRPGGTFIMIDNDHEHGQFAELLHASSNPFALRRQADVDAWWAAAGADRLQVLSSWTFDSTSELAAVVNLEFPDGSAAEWLASDAGVTSLTYGFVLFIVRARGSDPPPT